MRNLVSKRAAPVRLSSDLGMQGRVHKRPHFRIGPQDRSKNPIRPLLCHQEVMQDQIVDTGGQEAANGILRGLDDRFTLHVEGRV